MNRFIFLLVFINLFFIKCTQDDDTSSPSSSNKPTTDILVASPTLNPEVAGYLPAYKYEKYPVIDYSKVTQLFHFNIYPNSDGTLQNASGVAGQGKYIKTLIPDDIELFITLGGPKNADIFAALSNNDSSRTAFVDNVVNFCVENEYDGADIDWEFPSNDEELENFTLLIKELSENLHENDLLLSCALMANTLYVADESLPYMDQINVMAYNDGGEHSTIQYAETCLKFFLNKDVPRDKIMLGVPFYGKKLNQWDDDAYISYETLVDSLSPTPDQDMVGEYSINGINTMKEKTNLAITAGCKGVMIWEITQDTQADSTSLLNAIDEAIKEY